jgi:chromosome segregation ATPase
MELQAAKEQLEAANARILELEKSQERTTKYNHEIAERCTQYGHKIKKLEGDVLMLKAGLLSSESYAKGMEEEKKQLNAVVEVLYSALKELQASYWVDDEERSAKAIMDAGEALEQAKQQAAKGDA